MAGKAWATLVKDHVGRQTSMKYYEQTACNSVKGRRSLECYISYVLAY
jgi:hypothetical protein